MGLRALGFNKVVEFVTLQLLGLFMCGVPLNPDP